VRFSLMTLLLISVWVGAGLGVWFRREAWVLERIERDPTLVPSYPAAVNISAAPDGIRKLHTTNPFTGRIDIYDDQSADFSYTIDYRDETRMIFDAQFENDDLISFFAMFNAPQDEFVLVYMRRRFPEWWWGHFYRLEVWAFALITIVLLVRGVQALRRGRVAGAV
jgi:hypothetical protein